MSAIFIRPEKAADIPAIFQLTEAAFRDAAHSDGNEQCIVDDLRANSDLALSLVAEDADRLVGHIAFSPVTISDGATDWYGLGPVSVWPDLHGNGIGSALIKRGLADVRARGAHGVVLLGSPDYYGRFGFAHDPALTYPGPPPEYFQMLALQGDAPRGEVAYAPAFG